ncbi:twin-arginine translocase subunit TatC [Corynebacterium sp. A21]|uniref:twin-arginine translocase subunit TatC n=1 Tax=Corynebacterium sp. A21 TaxID=3457318 RepID=UPI003FCF8E87
MSLVDHLRELRRRVIYAVIALLIGSLVGFFWYQHAVNTPWFTLSSLGDILRDPYCALPPESRADFSFDGECRLLATGPFEMFLLRMKVGALAGIVLSSPVWLYQVWAFVTPGLHKGERRWTFTFVGLAVILFVAGAVLAYFVVDYGLAFLMTIGDEFQAAALTGEKYFNFVLALLLIFGVSFEVPLIIGMLNVVGILAYEDIKDKRRMIVIILFVFAAVMTPGQDPFSMVILAFALTILVELAIQFCRWNDKRRDKHRPEWLDQDDEAASALDYTPAPIDPAESGMQVQTRTDLRAQPPATQRPQPQHPPENFGGGSNFDDVL